MKIVIKEEQVPIISHLMGNEVHMRALIWLFNKYGKDEVLRVLEPLLLNGCILVLYEGEWIAPSPSYSSHLIYTTIYELEYEVEQKYKEKFMTNRDKSTCWYLKEGELGSVSVFRQDHGEDHSKVVISNHAQFLRNCQSIHEVTKEEFDSILLRVLDNAPKVLSQYGLMEYYPEAYYRTLGEVYLWYYKEGNRKGRFLGCNFSWSDAGDNRDYNDHVSISKEEFLALASKFEGWEAEAKLGGFPVGKTLKEWLLELPSWLSELAVKNTKEDQLSIKGIRSMSEAIGSAFVWHKSPERDGFWSKYCKLYEELERVDVQAFSNHQCAVEANKDHAKITIDIIASIRCDTHSD